MNIPPSDFRLVPAAELRFFATSALETVGMPEVKARFLADRLVENDLRGVFSHGTRQLVHYVPEIQRGEINPRPNVSVTHETPPTIVVDGNGGLGYFPAYEAAERITEKALAMGAAAAVTRNHGHIGAAGIYSRIPAARGLFCFVTSGCQLDLKPGQSVMGAAGGSPMSFAIPAGDEPPLVLDFGATQELYAGSPNLSEIARLAPGTVARNFGLGCVCQALGGLLAGVPLDAERVDRTWSGANQGGFLVAVDLKQFGPFDSFKNEMDEYSRRVGDLTPLPGFESAVLPGGIEAERERKYTIRGIPVGPKHADALRGVAANLGIQAPV